MKPLPLNPYIAGNPVSDPKGFFGREDIFREVMQVLRHPHSNAIVLYGQRRIGKTSVLLQLEKQLAAGGEFTPVYFDLQDKAAKPLSDVLYELAQRIVAKTGQTGIDRANFDGTGKYFHKNFIPAAVNAAAKGGLVLLFDEFDVLDSTKQNQAGEAFFPYLRAWMAEVQRVKFVFVIGRRPEDLSIDTMSTFKAVRSKRVSLFERSDAEALIGQSKHDGSLVWDKTAVEKVWSWAQGHPYLTQLLCSAIWENAYDINSSTAPRVEAANVDAAIDKTLQHGANAFHWIWSGLPPAERVVMAAMAEAGDVVITQKQLIEILRRSGVRLIVRALELAPETLTEWELLRPDKNGYRFVVPLLRRWVATNRPLRRVKEELDRLDPLAENLFQTGQSFYSLSQPAEAESQLRQALRINPNHLKSRLLLGRILLENEKPLESVDVLEEAFRYDEGAARADLIKALLALADAQTATEQLATYDRVLAIDREQPLVKERRQAIWLKRGETALQQNDLETALAAFQTAGDAARIAQVQLLQRKRQLLTQIGTAAQQESKENWEPVITIYENLLREFPEEGEWQAKLQNAKTQTRLAKLYSEALGILETGNSVNAQRLLTEVIAQQPDYKEAARHLLRAITGVDVAMLKQYKVAMNARIEARAPASVGPPQKKISYLREIIVFAICIGVVVSRVLTPEIGFWAGTILVATSILYHLLRKKIQARRIEDGKQLIAVLDTDLEETEPRWKRLARLRELNQQSAERSMKKSSEFVQIATDQAAKIEESKYQSEALSANLEMVEPRWKRLARLREQLDKQSTDKKADGCYKAGEKNQITDIKKEP